MAEALPSRDRLKARFFKDALWFTFTSFGGPQAHIAMMLRSFVQKRKYLTEDELMELYALAQVLPGPSSSQTLVGIAYKIGGLYYALVIFLIWLLPPAVVMFLAALFYKSFKVHFEAFRVLEYIESIALGFIAYAGFSIFKKSIKDGLGVSLAVLSLCLTLVVDSFYIFPILILFGGVVASVFKAGQEEKQLSTSLLKNINLKKVVYFLGIFLFFVVLGAIIHRTSPFSLPVRLFQNFYRNGIFVYGGGQVLIPFLYTEFVHMKHYITSDEFLFGYALQQSLPGPVFSFTSYIGALAMGNAGYRTSGQLLGSLVGIVGINAPGLILMLFIVPFWEELKKITHIKNSLSGINAVTVGFVMAAFLLLEHQVPFTALHVGLTLATFLLLTFTRIPAPVLIAGGVVAGFFFKSTF